jgi:hypothetical protein
LKAIAILLYLVLGLHLKMQLHRVLRGGNAIVFNQEVSNLLKPSFNYNLTSTNSLVRFGSNLRSRWLLHIPKIYQQKRELIIEIIEV